MNRHEWQLFQKIPSKNTNKNPSEGRLIFLTVNELVFTGQNRDKTRLCNIIAMGGPKGQIPAYIVPSKSRQ
jgi:hypothetical protein